PRPGQNAPAFFVALSGRRSAFRPGPGATQTSRQEITVKFQRMGSATPGNGGWAGGASIREQQPSECSVGSVAGVSCDACEAGYPWPRLHGRRDTSSPLGRDAISSSGCGGTGRCRRGSPQVAGQGSDRPPPP